MIRIELLNDHQQLYKFGKIKEIVPCSTFLRPYPKILFRVVPDPSPMKFSYVHTFGSVFSNSIKEAREVPPKATSFFLFPKKMETNVKLSPTSR